MNRLKNILLVMVLVVFSIFTFACNDKGSKDAAISNATVKGLDRYYYVDSEVDLTGISVEVEFDNNTKTTYSKYEVDVELENAKEDTIFIVYTDGLVDTNGKAQLGTHQIKYTIVGTDIVKADAFVVTVNTDQSLAYELDSFGLPVSILAFKNFAFSNTDEAKFYEVNDKAYYVGDDNEFIFKPNYELSDEDGEVEASLNTVLKVELKDGETYTVVGDEYYTYNPATYGIDFTNTAVGKTFRLTISAKDFEKDINNIDAVATFEVIVADGWNVTDAKDLGRMSFYDGDVDLALMHVFDDHVDTNAAWRTFLDANDAQAINGLFLHGNIEVTAEDVPSAYLISGQNSFANGGLWDYSTLYMKYLTNKDFTFNGNYFTLDFSKFPIVMSQGLTPYTSEDDTSLRESHARAFHFVGQMRESAGAGLAYDGIIRSAADVTFKNVNFVGNIDYNADKTKVNTHIGNGQLKSEFACCGIIGVSCEGLAAHYSNMIAKNMYIPYYVDGNSNVDIDRVKAYDCFNCGIYNYGGPVVNVSKSIFKRFGGPAMFMNSLTNNAGELEVEANISLSADCVVENYVEANSAWFSLYSGSGLIVTGIVSNPAFAAYNIDQIYYRVEVDNEVRFMKRAEMTDAQRDKLGRYTPYLNFIGLQFSKIMESQPKIYSTFNFNVNYAMETYKVNDKYNEFMSLIGKFMTIANNEQNPFTVMTEDELTALNTYIPLEKLQTDGEALQTAFNTLMADTSLTSPEAQQAFVYLLQNTPVAVHYFITPSIYEAFIAGNQVFMTSNGFVPGEAGSTIIPDSYDTTGKNNLLYVLVDGGALGQYGVILDYTPYNIAA